MKTNCFVCNIQIENLDDAYSEVVIHPIGGTVFRTYGHYGSGVYDPIDPTYLEIVICDSCLKNRMGNTYNGRDGRGPSV